MRRGAARSLGVVPDPEPSKPKLQLRGVRKSFPTQRGDRVLALEDITFDVAPGEFVCLLGPSGSGKSTLLNVLAGLDSPDAGTVTMNGKPITGPGPDRAVLFQEPALFPWMTVQGNVEFALRMVGTPAADRPSVAARWLSKVHLARFADAQPHELSGGMRQRAALARALACSPEVLLADEPFGSLDAQAREALQVEVQRVWGETGTTFVFVTHNVREAALLADRVLLMSAGPGVLLEEYRIRVPRPRHLEDALLSRVVVDIHDRLSEEVSKVAARETGEPTGLG
ncbi:MAG TPA: ABC transporter ATP-binding protein [Actinomycetota bacterium]|nr:ABC transporter ATP-binding protein [Actinomycetota bacterium]